jgi:glycosyltransferase involved in cell wall biosynthesis
VGGKRFLAVERIVSPGLDAEDSRPGRSGSEAGGPEALTEGTFAVIPAFNAGPRLAEVVRKTSRWLGPDRVLVVDDGSEDGEPGRLRAEGAWIVEHAVNQGKGAALRTGFAAVLKRGARGVLTVDADGQHDPDWIPRFLEAAAEGDIVLGSRMRDPGPMPWLRVIVNRLTSAVVSRMAGTRITDSQSGFRWIAARVLRAVPLESRRFDAESEILIKAACLGFRIREIPMPAVYEGELSKVHPVRDTLRFLRLVGRSLRWRRDMRRLRGDGIGT